MYLSMIQFFKTGSADPDRVKVGPDPQTLLKTEILIFFIRFI